MSSEIGGYDLDEFSNNVKNIPKKTKTRAIGGFGGSGSRFGSQNNQNNSTNDLEYNTFQSDFEKGGNKKGWFGFGGGKRFQDNQKNNNQGHGHDGFYDDPHTLGSNKTTKGGKFRQTGDRFPAKIQENYNNSGHYVSGGIGDSRVKGDSSFDRGGERFKNSSNNDNNDNSSQNKSDPKQPTGPPRQPRARALVGGIGNPKNPKDVEGSENNIDDNYNSSSPSSLTSPKTWRQRMQQNQETNHNNTNQDTDDTTKQPHEISEGTDNPNNPNKPDSSHAGPTLKVIHHQLSHDSLLTHTNSDPSPSHGGMGTLGSMGSSNGNSKNSPIMKRTLSRGLTMVNTRASQFRLNDDHQKSSDSDLRIPIPRGVSGLNEGEIVRPTSAFAYLAQTFDEHRRVPAVYIITNILSH